MTVNSPLDDHPTVSSPVPTSGSGLPEHAELTELHERIEGHVVSPTDDRYAAARSGFNVLADQRPAAIVLPTNRFDVVEAVRFAAEQGLRVTVQATGHGSGTCTADTLMINTSTLTGVSVDPVERTAVVAAGTTWGPVLAAAAAHGLAPLVGSSSGVGAVGYTLGGGFGWLGRRFGLSSDAVRSFDVVTPDGNTLRVSTTSYPDIFWTLRGAGAGSIAVVTAMEIELFPVTTVYAGNLFYPAADAGDILRRFRDWAPEQSEELTSAVTLINFPPLETVPEPFRGKSFAVVRGCWSGDLDTGRSVIDEWRGWRPPVIDMWCDLPFAAVDAISMDPTEPVPAMTTTEWFDTISDEAIDILTARVQPSTPDASPVTIGEVRHAGGAVARLADDAVDGRGRSGRFLLSLVAMVGDPRSAPVVESWLQDTRDQLRPHVTGATFLNFTDGAERTARSSSSFADEPLRRAAAVKAALDPDDRFCHGIILR
ncbi:FAD-binding oxidoreductase [Gordonia soli]|uniref:Putative oxidoreductase n=1 Tax=Gordonia soli NBRC 108243 TaxID=1223545 RepID=M0QMQ5_9ACTN|nr:FAD-binding oxidoreductase [Gordonia soli]GAC69704.1 putative oxidoreductase [Gordonia soli NBRC 108243]